MRWQAGVSTLARRFADLTTWPDRFTDLLHIVVPVVQVGTDHPDAERATFIAGSEITPPAGDGVLLEILPTVAPVVIESCWVTGPGARDWHATFVDAIGTTPSFVLGSALSAQTAQVTIGPSVGIAATRMFHTLTDTVLYLPLAGAVLDVGRGLRVRSLNGGVTCSIGATWRCRL
jgi:hypothetical protein